VDAINRTAVHVTPFGDRLVLEDDRAAAVEARVAQLERQLAIELSYRDALAKMNEEYTASHNAGAKAEVLAMVRQRAQGACRRCSGSPCRRLCPGWGLPAQYNEWERNMRRLSEELRQYRTYASILRGPSEPGSPRPSGHMAEPL